MGYATRPDVDLQEVIIRGKPGQKVTVIPARDTDPGLILRSVTKRDKTRAAVYVDGMWIVVPAPPVDPPPPPEPPSGQPAFLSRPPSSPIRHNGGTMALITNKTVRGAGVNNPSGIGITIENVNGSVTIRDCDLADLIGGIFIRNCTGTLTIENVRERNIGDSTIGSGHSNYIQLAECSFTGFIRKNQFMGGRTEDQISTWHSGGLDSNRKLIIEDNRLQGLVTDIPTARAWNRSSGTGIIISDGKGSPRNGNIVVRRNSLLTPGQVGIQIIDGSNLEIYENLILGQRRPLNNNPMTTWEGTPVGVARDNRYYFVRENGDTPSPWLQGGINPKVIDLNNVEDPTLSASAMRVEL